MIGVFPDLWLGFSVFAKDGFAAGHAGPLV
jgi:hypothetical protein